MIDDDDDDDELNGQDETDFKQDDQQYEIQETKSGRRVGKRKTKETNKNSSNEPIPPKLAKQLTKLLEFVIKYRDK